MYFYYNLPKNNLFWGLVGALLILGVFSMGYFIANIIKIQKSPIIVEKLNDSSYSTIKSDIVQVGEVVASVNSDKYHYQWCPGAGRIKEENKIYFINAVQAEEAGFILAGNCQ